MSQVVLGRPTDLLQSAGGHSAAAMMQLDLLLDDDHKK